MEEENLEDAPPMLRSARRIRLVLDLSFLLFLRPFVSLLGLMLSTLLSIGGLDAGISLSILLSTLWPEIGESEVGDVGALRKDC